MSNQEKLKKLVKGVDPDQAETLIAYFGTICVDEDYDYTFLLRLLDIKLGRMQKRIHEHHSHCKLDNPVCNAIETIDLSVKLLKDWLDDDDRFTEESSTKIHELFATIADGILRWWD